MTIAIVGGGLSGLALAWHLQRRGAEVVVFERAARPGGAIHTLERDGAWLEQGPQSVRATGGATVRLIGGLGLIPQVVGPSPQASQRFVLIDGRLRPLPSGPGALLGRRALGRRALARLLLEPLISGDPRPGESVSAFVARRLGPQVAYPLIDAFVAGVFAGDAERLEAASAFPQLVRAEAEHGSIVAGLLRAERPDRPDWLPRSTFTFQGGVQTLPRALARDLGESLRLGVHVERVEPVDAGFRVWVGGWPLKAAQVVIAVPPGAAARIYPAWAPHLSEIPCAPVAAVHLGWPEGHGPPQQGFGWLAPSRERADVLGVIWVSRTFPHLAPGRDLVRVMIGGVRAPHLVELSDRALEQHALSVVRQVQGPVPAPDLVHVARHVPGIPQYVVGHADRVRALQSDRPGLHPLGWGYTGIGLSQGLAEAEALAARLVD